MRSKKLFKHTQQDSLKNNFVKIIRKQFITSKNIIVTSFEFMMIKCSSDFDLVTPRRFDSAGQGAVQTIDGGL